MGAPSREQFVSQVLAVVEQRFPLVRISRAERPFSMRINGRVKSLENLYRLSLLQPEDTRRHVERWIVEMLRANEGWPDDARTYLSVQDRLLPIIVADAPESGPEAQQTLTQPLLPGLAIAYGMDNDRLDDQSGITLQQFERWGISIDELHRASLANLWRKSETINAHFAQDDDSRIYLILFQMMDGCDASRILLPNLHDKLREYLGSPFAAALPNRDILLCFRNDEPTVQKLLPQIQSDFQQMPHQITDQLLLVTADGIAPR